MRKYFLPLGLALSLVMSTSAPALAQITIDNFEAPVQGPSGTDYLTISTGSDNFVQGGVDAIGGTRVYYGQKLNGTSSIQLGLSGNTGSGQAFRFVQNPVSQGRAKLLYGYSAVNTASLDANNYTAGHTLANLNLNAGTGTAVTMDYASGSLGFITVTLISGSEGAPQVSSVTLPGNPGFSNLLFPRAAFLVSNPALNFSDLDQIIVSLDGLPSTANAALDNITITAAAVPEPTVMALGGLSAIGLGSVVVRSVRSRRRRRRMAKLAKKA